VWGGVTLELLDDPDGVRIHKQHVAVLAAQESLFVSVIEKSQ